MVVMREGTFGRELVNRSINSQTYLSKLHKDPFKTIIRHYKKTCKNQKREEDRQSGINPEETEVDFALADIIQRFEEAQKIHQDASEKQKKKQSTTQQKQKTCEESH